MDKIPFDLKVFRETRSCRGVLTIPPYEEIDDSWGDQGVCDYQRGCAQGKFGMAVGVLGASGWPHNAQSWWDFVGRIVMPMVLIFEVADINNSGHFAEADAMILKWAVESGKFEFINGLPDVEIKELETVGSVA